ncbi:hypothetical protein I4U23_026626 [Adineta vaga]|nr:hypothetical protein I4U23_026626 [Adineta vaga]
MYSEISSNNLLFTKKLTKSKCLAISNLPLTATEETIKKYFERYGYIQSIRIDDQRFAFIRFFNRNSASKAHHEENILDNQQLRTAFHDDSTSVPKCRLNETSLVTSSIINPSLSSPSSINLLAKVITTTHDEQDKHTSHPSYSPEENTRHQVVPIERGKKRRIFSGINSKKTTNMSSSSCESERYYYHSSFHKDHQHLSTSNKSKTRILKISHLPTKLSNQTLQEKLRQIFADFKKSSHLLTIKIIDNYALLTFQEFEDVDKALSYVTTKSINGIQLKAEPYENSLIDIDEYSPKATRTLYIRNLPVEISCHELREICMEYGEIIKIDIKRHSLNQIFAFIQYTTIKSVVRAIKALERKFIYGHSLQLHYGKSQMTNVLWLDELPMDINETNLRAFLHRMTKVPSEKIMNISIDYRHEQKYPHSQCLVYFPDAITAQNVMDLIRGKQFDYKRIQVDFASKLFIEKFSNIIRQTNEKKSNEQRTCQLDRRYSKVSDSESSVTLSNISSSSQHHPSSDHSSINPKKLMKIEPIKDTNTERIFDWLMQNDRSSVNNDDEQEHPVEKKSEPNEIDLKNQVYIPPLTRKLFQTKLIPLESDPLSIQSDIRLKVYASISSQFIKTIYLPFPKFAKTLPKSSPLSMILNPKALLKRRSIELNKDSITQDLRCANSNNEQFELSERIRLLDKQIYEVNQQNSILSSITQLEKDHEKPLITKTTSNIQQKSLSRQSEPLLTTNTTMMTAKCDRRLSVPPFHLSMPSSLISPPSSATNQLCPLISTSSETCNNPSAKIKQKSIPPPLSAINAFQPLSNINNSPIFPTPKSMTPSSAVGDFNQSPQPFVLKSILKQPSMSSQSTLQETRKAVHIISTKSPSESTVKQTCFSDDKKTMSHPKSNSTLIKDNNSMQSEVKELPKQSILPLKNSSILSLGRIPKKINTQLVETNAKIPKLLKETIQSPVNTKTSSTTMKHFHSKSFEIVKSKIDKSLATTQFKKTFLSNTEHQQTNKKTLPNKASNLSTKINQKVIKKSIHNSKMQKKSMMKNFTFKSNTCMYDRVKIRSRNELTQINTSSTKNNHLSDENNDIQIRSNNISRLKRCNRILDSSDSENDKPTKIKMNQTDLSHRKICNSKENHDKNSIIKDISKKRSLTSETSESSEKKKSQTKTSSFIESEQSNKLESILNNTTVSETNTVSPKHLSIPDLTKIDNQNINIKTEEPNNLTDSNEHEEIILNSSSNTIEQDDFNKREIPNERSPPQSQENSIDTEANKTLQQPISESLTITFEHLPEITSDNNSSEKINDISQFLIDNIPDPQVIIIDRPASVTSSVHTNSSSFPLIQSTETLNKFDSHQITNHSHSTTSAHLFPQILTPERHFCTPHHQHFSYSPFISSVADSPPLSSRPPSTTSCNSIIGNSFYNSMLPSQQYYHEKESNRRDSITKVFTFPTTHRSHLTSDSLNSFQNTSDHYNYPINTQQMYNLYSYIDNIHWEGYIALKSDQVFIKTQLIVGNPQIARFSINYWNCDLNHHLRISQRMRLEKIQLDGVQQQLQIDNDYCILIGEANGFTPDEIRSEQNHLKNGVIQYLNEKQAAGIINISLPGVVQPVYVVHIFPPCQFASEILQKHAPDAFRCVVQNKLEQIYLLFVITTTI